MSDDQLLNNNQFVNPRVGDVGITRRGTDFIDTNVYVNRQRTGPLNSANVFPSSNRFPYSQRIQILEDLDDPLNNKLANQSRRESGLTGVPVSRQLAANRPFGVPKEEEMEQVRNNQLSDRFVKKSRVNIDSGDRNKSPQNKLENTPSILGSNPLSFTSDSQVLRITHPQHGRILEDRIILQNAVSRFVTLKNPFSLEAGSDFLRIEHPNHGIVSGEDRYNDLKITISGARGNTRTYTYINNIPVNVINKTHKLFLRRTETDSIDPNGYYIQLPLAADVNFNDTDNDITNRVEVKFLNIAGVPLNEINANFPLNINQITGFHTITNIVDEDTYEVELSSNASITTTGGGNNVLICLVVDFVEGFPDPNNYKIRLERTFYNVKKIKLISTEFPNTEKVIKDQPENRANNKLVWQNLDDGDQIYSLAITPGNYDKTSIVAEIKEQWENVQRVNLPQVENIEDGNRPVEIFQFHRIDMTIDDATDIVQFKSFNSTIIDKPITISPETFSDTNTRIVVNHKQHMLEVGDTIVIESAIATDGIPADVLNAEHTVEETRGADDYIIRLPKFNPIADTTPTGGGVAVNILSPLMFRMFFDGSDTLGDILGFRNVGEPNAITPFEIIVANNKPYEQDFFQNEVGNETGNTEETVQNNIVNLTGADYILMTCAAFDNSYNTGPVTNVFAKILLTDVPGTVLFNQFVQLAYEFEEQVPAMSEIEYTFRNKNGDLVDFNNMDHSFTIEIHENNNELENTKISSRTGINTRTGSRPGEGKMGFNQMQMSGLPSLSNPQFTPLNY